MAREFGFELRRVEHFLYGLVDALDQPFVFTDSYRDTLRIQTAGSLVMIEITEWSRLPVSVSVPGYIYAEFVSGAWMTHSNTVGGYAVQSHSNPPLVKI